MLLGDVTGRLWVQQCDGRHVAKEKPKEEKEVANWGMQASLKSSVGFGILCVLAFAHRWHSRLDTTP